MTRWLMLLAAVTLLAGCNTISGIGKDVQAVGGAVDKAATETRKKM